MTAERYAAYDNGVLRITPTAVPPGLAIAGEIDEATYPALVTSLHELAGRHQDLHLDLSGVSYCDLAGLRAIVRLADGDGPGMPGTSGCGTSRRTSAMVLAITGWDALPGLAVEP